ncbi:hypothetical protein N9B38_02880 [bacterium]|nr:hypothetical protein [bacterium]
MAQVIQAGGATPRGDGPKSSLDSVPFALFWPANPLWVVHLSLVPTNSAGYGWHSQTTHYA